MGGGLLDLLSLEKLYFDPKDLPITLLRLLTSGTMHVLTVAPYPRLPETKECQTDACTQLIMRCDHIRRLPATTGPPPATENLRLGTPCLARAQQGVPDIFVR